MISIDLLEAMTLPHLTKLPDGSRDQQEMKASGIRPSNYTLSILVKLFLGRTRTKVTFSR